MLRAVDLVGAPAPSPTPTLGVLGASGAISYPAERVEPSHTGWTVTFDQPQHALGVVVRGAARLMRDTSSVTTTAGARYALNGAFQDALGQASWRPAGLWEDYARFRTDKIAPRVAVRGPAGATVRRVAATPWGTETDVVDTPAPATVVRSDAYLAGWRVSAQPVGGGPTRTWSVFAVGLVQGVRVPAGHWRLTFTYWPSGLTSGGIASALGAAAVVAVTGARLLRRRARERPVSGAGR
jgi:hypothetical protein